jgi:hypothetical protein
MLTINARPIFRVLAPDEFEDRDQTECCTKAAKTPSIGPRYDDEDLAGTFDDLPITALCGDGCVRCEKAVEALYAAGFHTVRQYLAARRNHTFDEIEILYQREDGDKRMSRLRKAGFAGIDRMIEERRVEFEAVKTSSRKIDSKISQSRMDQLSQDATLSAVGLRNRHGTFDNEGNPPTI